MPLTTAADLLDTLQQLDLLDRRRLNEVHKHLQTRQSHPARSVMAELVERGWLTTFQIDQLLAGEGPALVLGQYVLLELLGTGGMGQVFKSRHRRLDRIDAVKIIRPDQLANEEAVARFLREARAAARLSHPNLITIYDADHVGSVHFLAMEYVEGMDLARLVERQGKLIASEACDYIRQAALGLQHAHEQGLVHRDVKPHNLLVASKNGLVKVLDLGLARFEETGAEDSEQPTDLLTEPGTTMGTWDYLAPEQASDAHTADIRSDIYSLGCTFYHLLAGQPPFAGYAAGLKLVHHQTTEPKLIEDFRSDLPFGLGAVLRKMMAKNPEDRYQTPADVADALHAYSQESAVTSDVPVWQQQTTAMPPPVEPSPAPAVSGPPRSRRWVWLLAAGSGVLLLGGLIGLVLALSGWRTRPTTPETGPGPITAPAEFTNSIGMKLVPIPQGTFVMGSPPDEKGRQKDEIPHDVAIARPFYLGVCEVTQAEYREIMGNNPSWFSLTGGGLALVTGLDTRRFPVERVSWHDAVAFCQRLSEREKGRYRLPTEAEWEYACRAGKATPFHWGAELRPDQANFDATFGKGTAPRRTGPVDQHPANAWGVHGLHGNVWEWCADVYDEDAYIRKGEPPKPKEGVLVNRVIRGGGYGSLASECRCAMRGGAPSDLRVEFVGFRVAVDAP